MVTLPQRITELRTQRGLTRPALSAALGLPRNAIEKFEAGRQTPTKDQQAKLAAFFGVSLLYLQGESDDPTQQDSWITAALSEAEPDPEPVFRPKSASKPVARSESAAQNQGALVRSFLENKAFQDTVRTMVLETLRTPEGQELLAQIVRKELNRADKR